MRKEYPMCRQIRRHVFPIVSVLLTIVCGPAMAQLEFTASTPLGTVEWNDVAYADGMFVAVGGTENSPPVLAYSSDAETWAFGNIVSGSGGSGLLGISYGNNNWIGAGWNGTVLTSPDGINWTHRNSGVFAADTILDAACRDVPQQGANCVFSGTGAPGGPNEGTLLYRSRDDGVTWAKDLNFTTPAELSAAYFAPFANWFIIGGSNDTLLLESRDRFSNPVWNPISTGAASTWHRDFVFGNGVMLAVGVNQDFPGVGEISRTEDRSIRIWNRLPSQGVDELYGVAFGADVFVAVGRAGQAAVSVDSGATWDSVSTGTVSNLSGVAYGTGRFVAVGSAGQILVGPVAEAVAPTQAGSLRDQSPFDGSPDMIDTNPVDGGIYGFVTRDTSRRDVFVAEYDLSGIDTDFESVELRFNSGSRGDQINVGVYDGDGVVSASDYDPPGLTPAGTFVIPVDAILLEIHRVDLTQTVRSASSPTLGLHFSVPSGQAGIGGSVVLANIFQPPRLAFVYSSNEPPTVEAGPDQSVRAPATVQLAGSAFDDNTASADLMYQWSVQSSPTGSTVTFTNATQADTTVDVDLPGTYVLQLSATDEDGAESAPDTVSISSDNLAPTAEAGAGQMVVTGDTVNLNGSHSSDPEGNPLNFSWSLISPAGSMTSLANPGSETPSFIPDIPGNYEAVLIVSDALGPGAPDSVVVVASSRGDFAQAEIQSADNVVTSLDSTEVTTTGNQNALSNFLMQSTVAIQEGDTTEAIDKLDKAAERTDGCIERGEPDGNGPGRDWVTDCQAQSEIYEPIDSAREVLTQ